jgi:hypothetical protein
MLPEQETFVVVQADWNGWRTAEVRLVDLTDIHWLQPSGAPRPLIHAYIPCTHIKAGQIPHNCEQTEPPHQLLVCILKAHTRADVYEELWRRAVAGDGV